jgi:5-methylcytosine-specific restriction endonuclease McrA
MVKTRSSRLRSSDDVKLFVLQRDHATCQVCGAVSGEPRQDDIRGDTRIQVGRILAQALGGGNDPNNLRAICSVCNDGLRNLILDRPSLRELLVQIRRATTGAQLEVLSWLITKYPVQAAKIRAGKGKQRSG